MQAACWYTVLVPLVWLLWRLSSSYVHVHTIFNLWQHFQFNAIRVAYHIVVLLVAPWPSKVEEDSQETAYLMQILCIIPCHRSAAEFASTVDSILEHLLPKHVVVIDHGKFPKPLG